LQQKVMHAAGIAFEQSSHERRVEQ